MIWSDPWISAATDKSGEARRFCTLLPPPLFPLPADVSFVCTQLIPCIHEWIDLVGTRWSPEEVRERLTGAWILLLRHKTDGLVGTCVLRPYRDMWLLETLRARKGYGRFVMSCALHWIYDTHGPFVLGYVWELTGAQLALAWWKGWLISAAAIQYGWSWAPTDVCSFCPRDVQWRPKQAFPVLPLYLSGPGWKVIVSDSGLQDGWGHVLAFRGTPNWATVAKQGGWERLWMRAETAPTGWRWTGEFVVVGLLNHWGTIPSLEWLSAEI